VINGRPGVWGDGLIGLCRQSPLCEDIQETLEGEGDAREAVCVAKRRGSAPVIGRFSVADAKRASLWGKDIWSKYPDRMLRNRARGYALRDAFPDVLRGLKTGEELLDTPADDWRGPTIEAKPATKSESRPISGSPQPPQTPQQNGTLQAARTAHRETQQAAAVTPPPKKQTIAEFLDQLDADLEAAPEAAHVHAIMMSELVTRARGFLTNGAAERLSDWTVRAGQKRAALQEAERQQQAAPVVHEPSATTPNPAPAMHNIIPPPAETITAPVQMTDDMPDDIDEWPLAGEDLAGA
jgi:hypothetical protein